MTLWIFGKTLELQKKLKCAALAIKSAKAQKSDSTEENVEQE
jgi:hypothetical protein